MDGKEIKVYQLANDLLTAVLTVQSKAFCYGAELVKCDKVSLEQAKLEMNDATDTAENLIKKMSDLALGVEDENN